MKDKVKKILIPAIAAIFLITIGGVVFKFILDKYTQPNCQCCSPYPSPRLERPMFAIDYAKYNSSNNSLSFAIHNIGKTSIITKDLRVFIEEYYKINDSFVRMVVMNKKTKM